MSESDPENPDRPRGLLSERDRRYLLGESDIEPQTDRERKVRAEIRDRLWHCLLDFIFVQKHLDERDVNQILPVNPSGTIDSVEEAEAYAYQRLALEHAVGFILALTKSDREDRNIEALVADGLDRVWEEQAPLGSVVFSPTEVDITPPEVIDPDALNQKIQRLVETDGVGFEALSPQEIIYLEWLTDGEKDVLNQWVSQNLGLTDDDRHFDAGTGE